MNRRQFIESNAVLAAAAALGPAASGESAATSRTGKPLAGIQIEPSELLDEGIETCLDFLQEEAAVDALFCYSQTYHLGEAPMNILATDHPSPPRDPRGRQLPHLWMRLPREPFAGLAVQHEARREDVEYADRDLFAELVEPCRERGIKVYARILEAGMRRAERIPGYESVATVTEDGERGGGPCWNHPDYREWVGLTAREMMRVYPLDGLQYGAERVGPLSEVLFRGEKPTCFCQHCRARNEKVGIDVDRAAAGYRRLYELISGLTSGQPKPVDGVMTEVLRTLFRYPEVMAYYDQWFQADGEIQRLVYEAAKEERPEAEVGQHIDHQRSSWDIFYRAAVSYGEMAEYNDFIKPILYHEILGPRLQEWVIDRWHERVLADLSKDLALELFYALFGHDAAKEPSYEQLAHEGLSPEYVYTETKRCVEGTGGKAKVYVGVGMDVPHYVPGGMKRMPSDPESVYQATRKSIEAGADGVVASREYREIGRSSLQAFGRAVTG